MLSSTVRAVWLEQGRAHLTLQHGGVAVPGIFLDDTQGGGPVGRCSGPFSIFVLERNARPPTTVLKGKEHVKKKEKRKKERKVKKKKRKEKEKKKKKKEGSS